MKRRQLLQQGSVLLLLGTSELARGASILAVRVWPAAEYTRVTLESDTALKATPRFVANPPRLAVDIDDLELQPALRELVSKVRSDDPLISGVRVGQFAPGVVRLVLDLKQPAAPQVFSLRPVAAYGHRLVLDLYPQQALDPLDALIAQQSGRSSTPEQEQARAASEAGLASARAANPVTGPHPHIRDALGDLIAHKTQPRPAPSAAAAPSTPSTPSTAATALPLPAAPAAMAASAAASAAHHSPTLPEPQAAPPAAAPGRDTALTTERLVVVALDPGHGGEDPGAIGQAGTREKDVVLHIARRVRDKLNARTDPGGTQVIRAYLTRDADFFVPLYQRVQKARRIQADLFVSIHADAFITPAAHGASVFALSEKGASSSSARWLANKENKADLVGGLNVGAQDLQVQQAMLDMSTTAQIKDSLHLGHAMLGEMGQIGALHKRQVEQASFAVLKAPDIPSVLVETAFISNPDEEQQLRSDSYQDKLAEAIVRGILRYFRKNPPLARVRTT